jgi:phenylalanyl-tRNA synthetase beta subunit
MVKVIDTRKDHAIKSLAPIFSLKEINKMTGLDITRNEYLKILNHYGYVRTKTETKAKYRKMSRKSYQQLIKAKQSYCLAKWEHGGLDG